VAAPGNLAWPACTRDLAERENACHNTGIRFQPKSAASAGHFRFVGSLMHCANVRRPSCMLQGGNARIASAPSSPKGNTVMASINGTVKFFNTTKGFGFITPDNGGKDHFVHISAVQRSGIDGLYENDKVSYDVETGRDGRESAVNLTLNK
jgi:CspA family cold shock protein